MSCLLNSRQSCKSDGPEWYHEVVTCMLYCFLLHWAFVEHDWYCCAHKYSWCGGQYAAMEPNAVGGSATLQLITTVLGLHMWVCLFALPSNGSYNADTASHYGQNWSWLRCSWATKAGHSSTHMDWVAACAPITNACNWSPFQIRNNSGGDLRIREWTRWQKNAEEDSNINATRNRTLCLLITICGIFLKEACSSQIPVQLKVKCPQ